MAPVLDQRPLCMIAPSLHFESRFSPAIAGLGASITALTCIIHESFGFVNHHLQESNWHSCRFRRGAWQLAQG